jgi:hypothetical protein
MRLALIVLALVAGCTYNQADQAALAALANRMTVLEQRDDTLDARVAAHSEAIQTLNRRLYK